MTETETTEKNESPPNNSVTTNRGVEWYFHRAAIIVLVVLGIYVGFQFYWSAIVAINIWVPREYAQVFKAVFNLALLLVLGAALIRELRHISSNE